MSLILFHAAVLCLLCLHNIRVPLSLWSTMSNLGIALYKYTYYHYYYYYYRLDYLWHGFLWSLLGSLPLRPQTATNASAGRDSSLLVSWRWLGVKLKTHRRLVYTYVLLDSILVWVHKVCFKCYYPYFCLMIFCCLNLDFKIWSFFL